MVLMTSMTPRQPKIYYKYCLEISYPAGFFENIYVSIINVDEQLTIHLSVDKWFNHKGISEKSI